MATGTRTQQQEPPRNAGRRAARGWAAPGGVPARGGSAGRRRAPGRDCLGRAAAGSFPPRRAGLALRAALAAFSASPPVSPLRSFRLPLRAASAPLRVSCGPPRFHRLRPPRLVREPRPGWEAPSGERAARIGHDAVEDPAPVDGRPPPAARSAGSRSRRACDEARRRRRPAPRGGAPPRAAARVPRAPGHPAPRPRPQRRIGQEGQEQVLGADEGVAEDRGFGLGGLNQEARGVPERRAAPQARSGSVMSNGVASSISMIGMPSSTR